MNESEEQENHVERGLSVASYLGIAICTIYQLSIVSACLYLAWILEWETGIGGKELALRFALFGVFGGTFYCLRALYRHGCVYQNWDNTWIIWHLIRPFAAALSALAAFVLVQGGLVLLDAGNSAGQHQTLWGHYFIAFVAGLNVDQFHKWLERLAQSTLGISPSNQGR
ncbi:hypothetical protein [Marinobacter sp. OP 3.4]|uniref:hypothetical protein n=1 Tax=Marinobacter sp. OP 3.4 TaxID=3076501 RepID=UPI002E2188D9